MQITIYAKKRHSNEGKTFYSYLSTLTRHDGSKLSVTVKFRDNECGNPKPEQCPMNIIFDKSEANLTSREFERDNGEMGASFTLWVAKWQPGEQYVDHSLDEFV